MQPFYKFRSENKRFIWSPINNWIWDSEVFDLSSERLLSGETVSRGLSESLAFIKSKKTGIVEPYEVKPKLTVEALKPWMEELIAINAKRIHLLQHLSGVDAQLKPYYFVLDSGITAIQRYEYFWDDDPKFQRVMRDDMGGNHQWLFFWVNAGGRTGQATITEVMLPPVLAQLIINFKSSGAEDEKVIELIKHFPSGPIPEFNKADLFLKKRLPELVAQGEEEHEAFGRVMAEYERKLKAKDPEVYYPEYANMGFPHPRPDYRDERYK